MTQQFPPKPWVEGDTFVNIETGVQYAFNGEQWLSGGSQYQAGYTERGTFEYRRSSDPFGTGIMQNAVNTGSRPYDSLTRIKLHKTSKNSNTAPAGYYQPGQLLRFKKNADAAIYRITTVDADNDNFYLIDVTFAGLQGQGFSFFVYDDIVVECREIEADSSVDYLPLTGGTITGDLEVSGTVETLNIDSGENSNLNLKCDGATKIYVGANKTTIQNPLQLNTEGTLEDHAISKGYVDTKFGSYLPLTGGTITGNLSLEGILKFSDGGYISVGNSERILFQTSADGNDGNAQVTISRAPDNRRGFALKGKDSNGAIKDLLYTYTNPGGPDAINYIGKQGAGTTNVATCKYVDDALGDVNLDGYLPLTGGTLTGELIINKSTQVALDIIGDGNTSQIKFWSSGAVAIQNYTGFKDNELVTKKYVDDKVAADGGGSSFTPGDQVAKTNGESNQVGGFWIAGGALYVKVS